MELKENNGLESKLLAYQDKYYAIINELNVINERLKYSQKSLSVTTDKYIQIEQEYTQIKILLDNMAKGNIDLLDAYISNRKLKIILRAIVAGGLIGGLTTFALSSFEFGGIINSLWEIGAITGGIVCKKNEQKILNKLYIEYKNSAEYETRMKITDEKLKLRQDKLDEMLEAAKKYAEAKKNNVDLLREKNDKIQEIINLRKDILELVATDELLIHKYSGFITSVFNSDIIDETSKEKTKQFIKTIKQNDRVQ